MCCIVVVYIIGDRCLSHRSQRVRKVMIYNCLTETKGMDSKKFEVKPNFGFDSFPCTYTSIHFFSWFIIFYKKRVNTYEKFAIISKLLI